MSQKRKRDDAAAEEVVFRSEAVEDRDSTFVGLFSPTIKPKDLQRLDDIKSASHKILAWRKESNQQSITGASRFSADSDDDGEKYAGKRVEKVLNAMQVTGACVVARWYGGTLLGPARFDHIENCAREAVQKWQDGIHEERIKKVKLEQDEEDKVRMLRVLGERDGSIEVLRRLATEKENKVKQIEDAEANTSVAAPSTQETTPKAAPDYTALPIERLRALEKARDATLGFLLKRIDKAEAALNLYEMEQFVHEEDGD